MPRASWQVSTTVKAAVAAVVQLAMVRQVAVAGLVAAWVRALVLSSTGVLTGGGHAERVVAGVGDGQGGGGGGCSTGDGSTGGGVGDGGGGGDGAVADLTALFDGAVVLRP